jgi:hypothetical protein
MAATVPTKAGTIRTSKSCKEFYDLTNVYSDQAYPDPYAGGYNGPKNCGGFTPTSVISISYTANEGSMSAAYMNRQCNE